MNLTSVLLMFLISLMFFNISMHSRQGKDIHSIKCDVESVRNQNSWMRERVENRGEK